MLLALRLRFNSSAQLIPASVKHLFVYLRMFAVFIVLAA